MIPSFLTVLFLYVDALSFLFIYCCNNLSGFGPLDHREGWRFPPTGERELARWSFGGDMSSWGLHRALLGYQPYGLRSYMWTEQSRLWTRATSQRRGFGPQFFFSSQSWAAFVL